MTKPFDPIALKIGAAYDRARGNLIEAGELLAGIKRTLKRGKWLPWLKANADALVFRDPSTATRLMRLAANPASTHDLWGNRRRKQDDDGEEVVIPPAQPSLTQVRLTHESCELVFANAVVAAWHRHHKPLPGHRFSIKCIDENGVLRGVAIVGRPLARLTCQRTIVELTLMCSDGTPNVCSFLYGVCSRAAKVLGYKRIQTFTLVSEPGTSLKAAGWILDGISEGGDGWQSRAGRRNGPTEPKKRWVKIFRPDLAIG